ncbi:MAG: NERD domain-containing protein, partial [Erysipelotrichaceae bacterium]|nr:NERD domain-containing protein [Erysipelotrichaceae bacterium]
SVQKDLKQILLKDDLYFSNVNVVYGKQKTELDNLIVNRNGIFIVEVKSYSGELYGIREDRQWLKQRFSGGGKLYQKHVDNPIGQVKRQEFILSRALKEHGISAWVTGYIYFTNHNAPFADDYFIDSYRELKQIIHSRNNDPLTKKQILQIKALIEKKKLQ